MNNTNPTKTSKKQGQSQVLRKGKQLIKSTKMFFSSIFVGNKNLPAYLPTSQIMCHETTNQQFHMDGLTKFKYLNLFAAQ
jgi:hypothetical protein